MRNTFGTLFTLTTFGESHGAAIGGVVDGMPAGIDIDTGFIQHELSRRRPGQSRITTSRNEPDQVELLSGVFEGKSTGTPIGFMVRNTNQHSHDYDNLRDLFRPSHADYTYYYKYGIRDHRGGGRSSARVTISRCVGGALAKLALRPLGITVQAYVSQVGTIATDRDYRKYDLSLTESNIVRCPDPQKAREMEELIMKVKGEGDTIGGVVTCVVKGCPPGLGEPEFGKLHAQLGAAMLSINAAKGFEYGDGFDMVTHRGSEVNDIFYNPRHGDGRQETGDIVSGDRRQETGDSQMLQGNLGDGRQETGDSQMLQDNRQANVSLQPPVSSLQESNHKAQCSMLKAQSLSNHSGGIQGGISNGQDIYFRVAFKPVATILKPQPTVDIRGNAVTMEARGRHDPCVVPRAVPIVEDMAAMVILDNYLMNRTVRAEL